MRTMSGRRALALALVLALMVSACSKDYSPLNPQVSSFAPAPPRWPVLFEDFERGAPPNVYFYPDPVDPMVGSATYATEVGGAYQGFQSQKFGFSSASAGYAGAGFGTNYPSSGQAGVDASGAVRFSVWVKADQAVSLKLIFKEGNVSGSSPLNEEWRATLSVPGSGSWVNQSVTIASMVRSKGSGDNVFNLNNLVNLDVSVGSNVAPVNVNLDLIQFWDI